MALESEWLDARMFGKVGHGVEGRVVSLRLVLSHFSPTKSAQIAFYESREGYSYKFFFFNKSRHFVF